MNQTSCQLLYSAIFTTEPYHKLGGAKGKEGTMCYHEQYRAGSRFELLLTACAFPYQVTSHISAATATAVTAQPIY